MTMIRVIQFHSILTRNFVNVDRNALSDVSRWWGVGLIDARSYAYDLICNILLRPAFSRGEDRQNVLLDLIALVSSWLALYLTSKYSGDDSTSSCSASQLLVQNHFPLSRNKDHEICSVSATRILQELLNRYKSSSGAVLLLQPGLYPSLRFHSLRRRRKLAQFLYLSLFLIKLQLEASTPASKLSYVGVTTIVHCR